jgi:hypothetical protein
LTLGTYTHVVPELARDAAARMGYSTRHGRKRGCGCPRYSQQLLAPDVMLVGDLLGKVPC